MTFFLFKPHIVAPTGDITTPDLLIDRVYVSQSGDFAPASVNSLSSEIEVSVDQMPTKLEPMVALISAGGGTIVSPAIRVIDPACADVVIDVRLARSGWRLDRLGGEADEVAVKLSDDEIGTLDIQAMIDQVRAFSGRNDQTIGRGVCILSTLSSSLEIERTGYLNLAYDLKPLKRSLVHKLALSNRVEDEWGERPMPRYTVGPQHDGVKHYI